MKKSVINVFTLRQLLNTNLFLLASMLLLSCQHAIDDMEYKFSTHTNKFEELRKNIQSQNSVKFLLLNTADDSARVTAINGWFLRQNNQWEKWDRYEGVTKFKDSFIDVLSYEHINQKDYAKTMKGMLNLDIEVFSVGEEYYCPNCIEIESKDGVSGLRYYQSNNARFEPDDEYISVRKVAANWYAYQRDWN